jgi:GGDEF domain-containing protein
MSAIFIDRMSQMTESTGAYHGKLEENARRIEQAKSIREITPVLKEVMGATRTMAHDSLTARDTLRGLHVKTQANELELAKLHQELDRASALARHNALTGALNRKGLEEALQRELTKRFFMTGSEKILITFSAGVAQLDVDETGPQVIRRADQVMYLAKRSGKNRVLGT